MRFKFSTLLLSSSLLIHCYGITGEVYELNFKENLINISLKNEKFLKNEFNMIVEIPAGTSEKWEYNLKQNKIKWEKKNDNYRIIDFIPYVGNYGFFPMTISGDDDPLDVICLCDSKMRGTIQKVKIVGGLFYKDKKEDDPKIIAIEINSKFSQKINTLSDLVKNHPNALQIIKLWFDAYKKPGKMIFYKYLDENEAINLIEKSHRKFNKNN